MQHPYKRVATNQKDNYFYTNSTPTLKSPIFFNLIIKKGWKYEYQPKFRAMKLDLMNKKQFFFLNICVKWLQSHSPKDHHLF